MARGFLDQEPVVLFNVIAGAAANQEYKAYVDMRSYKSFSQEILFTAGAGGGTLSYKVYGTMKPFINESDAQYGDTGSIFQDITALLCGTSAITSSDIKSDSAGIGGKFTYLKISATLALTDTATVLLCYGRKAY